MTTLTAKTNMNIQDIIRSTEIHPSIPSFMEHATGHATILVRRRNEVFFTERWLTINAYCDYAECASEIEMSAFYDDVPYVDRLNLISAFSDIPEPISIHDQDVWNDIISDDEDRYHSYADDDYEDQRLYA